MKAIITIITLALLTSCMAEKKQEQKPKKQEIASNFDDKGLLEELSGMIEPLPQSIIDTQKNADLIHLGKKLYFEKKLSINDTISCNSCHNLETFGVDNQPTSPGHDGTRGGRNSPTVLNAALHFAQFWDGRAKDVEEQALGPILNPIEHGLKSEADAIKKINTAEYQELFKKAFGNDQSLIYKNIGVAIGAFERTLLTPSRVDDYLNGVHTALSEAEKKGLKKFNEIGCTSCHNGVVLGGNSYQKLGLLREYKTEDKGRFEVTKNEEDKFTFKVPSLRNISKTAPYFHDGSIQTLEEAIKIMANVQLDTEVSDEDIASIKAFLMALDAKEKVKY